MRLDARRKVYPSYLWEICAKNDNMLFPFCALLCGADGLLGAVVGETHWAARSVLRMVGDM